MRYSEKAEAIWLLLFLSEGTSSAGDEDMTVACGQSGLPGKMQR